MQSLNFRNCLHLYRYKVVFALLLTTFFCTSVRAQFTGGNNYNFYDFQNKPFYFGLTLGFNSSRYTPYRSEEFIFSDTIVGVKSLNGPGFNLNMIANLKIGQYFDFRFLPGFSFARCSRSSWSCPFTFATNPRLIAISACFWLAG